MAVRLQCLILTMKQVTHHGYAITATANNKKGVWRGYAVITWKQRKFDLHDPVCFPTETEAEEHAVELGKLWVNNHLQGMQGSS